jgi:glycosyltransferase involved in cell wall biosynthesis
VIEFYDGGALVPELERIPGVKRICLHKGNRWDTVGFLRKLVRALRESDPDVIHGYLYVSNILAVLCRPFLRRRTAIVMGVRSSNTHLEHYDWSATLCSFLERKLSRFADLLIANSAAGLHYCKEIGYAARRMVVVSNGIDIERFRPDETLRRSQRQAWGIREDEVLIGLAGRLDRKKNHPVFLRAAAALMKDYPNCRFVCIGRGSLPYSDELHRMASELGLDSRLTWTGEFADMASAYNALDISTLCSNAAEGFPNVLAEAMACGVPCVATDAGDARDILGPIGVVLPEPTDTALVAGWKQLLERLSPKLRAEARERIVSRYSIDRLASNTADLLRGLSWG